LQRTATGVLSGDHVMIPDQKQGSRLHNRGYYGTPLSGGGLSLELIEAFYLLDEQKLRVFKKKKELDLQDLLGDITKHEPTFEIKYIVYRDLRTRGLVLKTSNLSDFVIYDNSSDAKPGSRRQVKYWCQAVSERTPFHIEEISNIVSTANNTKKRLLIAVVDEEGDLTYYEINSALPASKKKSGKNIHKLKGSAVLIEDRVMLWEPELISELRQVGFYGKPMGSSLQLALTESAYLLKNGILNISLAKTKRKLSISQFLKIAKKIQPDIDLRLNVYNNLKDRNLIVKTGFKYGTHFRVYKGDPNTDHSEFLVHSIKNDYQTSWEEISRAVRLAQGVRKQMLFARVGKESERSEIEYINIERIKP
jgi:tRNA-intron endonuclease